VIEKSFRTYCVLSLHYHRTFIVLSTTRAKLPCKYNYNVTTVLFPYFERRVQNIGCGCEFKKK